MNKNLIDSGKLTKSKSQKDLHLPVASESIEQQCLFRWAQFMSREHPELDLMFHIPNGGKRDLMTAVKLKAEGVKAGVPDIHLPVARGEYHGLFIEMKKLRGGKTTEEQDYWLKALTDQGYKAIVCKGWEEASKAILNYLEGLK
jgi:hypothetical protein